MRYILDTNAYRNLVKDRSIQDIPLLAERLKAAEVSKGASASMSIVVAMELIQHLQDGDPEKEECFKALCLLSLHTQRPDESQTNAVIDFVPSLNTLLPDYFFNDATQEVRTSYVIIDLVLKLTRVLNIDGCKEFESEVQAVKSQIQHEKSEYKNNVEDFLASLNGGEADWKYFQNNGEERKKYFRRLNNREFDALIGTLY